jgi:hypothetical protein
LSTHSFGGSTFQTLLLRFPSGLLTLAFNGLLLSLPLCLLGCDTFPLSFLRLCPLLLLLLTSLLLLGSSFTLDLSFLVELSLGFTFILLLLAFGCKKSSRFGWLAVD